MSTQALGASAVDRMQNGELAAAQRVSQLQALIQASRQVASASPSAAAATDSTYSQSSSSDFASALQAATTVDSAAGAQPIAFDPTAPAVTVDAAYAPEAQGLTNGGEGSQYEALVNQAAARYGLDPAVLHGLIEQESGFDPNATSGAGAVGLTQLMPGTASSLGVADPRNPAESIEGGARYLSEMLARFSGNDADALAAYNAGPGAVEQYGGVPPYAETESYVSKVLDNAQAYRQAHPYPATTGVLT